VSQPTAPETLGPASLPAPAPAQMPASAPIGVGRAAG
jgi:hypothetical protein